jgi:hypothetical protein
MDALYGQEGVTFETGRPETARPIRRNDGIFGADRERRLGRHRRVSAVVIVSEIQVWKAAAGDVAIYDNPYADRPLPTNLIPHTRRFGPAGQDKNGVRFDWL